MTNAPSFTEREPYEEGFAAFFDIMIAPMPTRGRAAYFVGVWAMTKFLGVLVAALVAWALAATAALAEHGRWQALENNPSCVVWNAKPQSNETVTWSGACANGKTQGRGTQVWRSLKDGEWKAKYTGNMKDGKWHGRGVLVWASGTRYEGGWKDGERHGRGVYVAANGDRYEGEFRDDKQNGRGVAVFANGDEYEGEFRDGRLLGTGKGRENGQFKKCYFDGNTIKFTD